MENEKTAADLEGLLRDALALARETYGELVKVREENARLQRVLDNLLDPPNPVEALQQGVAVDGPVVQIKRHKVKRPRAGR